MKQYLDDLISEAKAEQNFYRSKSIEAREEGKKGDAEIFDGIAYAYSRLIDSFTELLKDVA